MSLKFHRRVEYSIDSLSAHIEAQKKVGAQYFLTILYTYKRFNEINSAGCRLPEKK